MDKKLQWRILAEWREYQGRIDLSLSYDDQDALITGTIKVFGDESFRIYLGDRPPHITDPFAMRLLMAMYQYLDGAREGECDTACEEIDLLAWLGEQVGTENAAAIYLSLNFKLAEKTPEFLPPSSALKDPLPNWHFSFSWLEGSGAEWRLARLDLTWHQGQESGGLVVVVKTDIRGETVVKEVENDDLLLPAPEMWWLVGQLVNRFWKQILALGSVQTDLENLPHWLSWTRGHRGPRVLGMIENSLRTFGVYPPRQQ